MQYAVRDICRNGRLIHQRAPFFFAIGSFIVAWLVMNSRARTKQMCSLFLSVSMKEPAQG